MVTHLEASRLMSDAIERAKTYMRKHGFVFPLIYIFNKEKPIQPEIENGSVLQVRHDEQPDHGVYKTIIGFKMSCEEDDRQMEKIFATLAKEYNPDAMGMVVSVFYNEFPEELFEKATALSTDPDSWMMLHSFFYLREDPKAAMRYIPYTDRGLSEKPDTDTGKPQHDITFMDYPWTRPLQKIGPRMPNPYK